MTMEAKFTKRALRREEGYPIGYPAPSYILCECGNKVSVPVITGLPMTFECLCGIEYDSRGYILGKRQEWTPETARMQRGGTVGS